MKPGTGISSPHLMKGTADGSTPGVLTRGHRTVVAGPAPHCQRLADGIELHGPTPGFSLAAIVLFSVVLPLSTNPWLTRASRRRTYFRRVWVGQSLAAVGGLWVIAAPIHPEYGLVVTVIACLACLPVLRR